MDWNDLRFFLEVARAGTTLGASKTLRVSQSTVARRIAALEEALGLELFEKLQSGYALTEAGHCGCKGRIAAGLTPGVCIALPCGLGIGPIASAKPARPHQLQRAGKAAPGPAGTTRIRSKLQGTALWQLRQIVNSANGALARYFAVSVTGTGD